MRTDYFSTTLPQYSAINSKITKRFYELLKTDSVNRTHYFNNRYENLYIPLSEINDITHLIEFSKSLIREQFPDIKTDKLKAGFWFNLMAPGDITLPHTHDDDSELLSAVYYLYATEKSGDLILHCKDKQEIITPYTGQFIFFPPTLKHEVSENRSNEDRLSVAFNFGY